MSIDKALANELRIANAKLAHESARADHLSGTCHKLRGELDGAKRSLDTQRRLLGEATERAELLKQSRGRAYSVIDAHAGRLDELTAAIGRGDTEEATRLAEAWDRRE